MMRRRTVEKTEERAERMRSRLLQATRDQIKHKVEIERVLTSKRKDSK